MATIRSEGFSLSRRGLVAGAAGLAAAAHVFTPRFVRPGRAAQETSAPPAPSGQQVLRWGGTRPIPRLSMVGCGQFIYEHGQNIHLTPFVQRASGEIAPGVCLDYTISEDGLVYEFALDPAARFSDGSKVTAGDIKFTWEWLASPASEYAFRYYMTQAVVGHDEVVAGTATTMAGLTAIDDETLGIELKSPFTPFINYCACSFTAIYQRKAIEEGGTDWDARPFPTCGPYAYDSFDAETGEVSLVPNPHWWREAPLLERIEYRVAPDPNSLSLLNDNDEIDGWRLEDTIALEIINGSNGADVVETPSFRNEFFTLDVRLPPTDDVNVRLALLKATDVETIVPAIYGDAFQPAFGVNHPDTPGAVSRRPFFDPNGAQAALAASSYGGPDNLPPVILGVAASAPSPLRRVVEAVAQGWQDVPGIDATVLPTDPGVNPAELGAQTQRAGNTTLFIGPGALLTWGFRADNAWFSSRIGIADADVEAQLSEEICPASEFEARAEAYAAAESLILERAYAIPVLFGYNRIVTKPWVADARFNPNMTLEYDGVYVAER